MGRIRFINSIVALIFLTIQVLSVSAGEVKQEADLVALVGPPEGWTVPEPPQTAEGKQLFQGTILTARR